MTEVLLRLQRRLRISDFILILHPVRSLRCPHAVSRLSTPLGASNQTKAPQGAVRGAQRPLYLGSLGPRSFDFDAVSVLTIELRGIEGTTDAE